MAKTTEEEISREKIEFAASLFESVKSTAELRQVLAKEWADEDLAEKIVQGFIAQKSLSVHQKAKHDMVIGGAFLLASIIFPMVADIAIEQVVLISSGLALFGLYRFTAGALKVGSK